VAGRPLITGCVEDQARLAWGCRAESSSRFGAGEVRAGEADGHPAIAGGGGDHLCRSGANIPDREHAGPAGLNQEGLAPERLPGLTLAKECAELGGR
jgi:hypothetical protein